MRGLSISLFQPKATQSDLDLQPQVTLPSPGTFSRTAKLPYYVVFTTTPRSNAMRKEIASDATIAVSLVRQIALGDAGAVGPVPTAAACVTPFFLRSVSSTSCRRLDDVSGCISSHARRGGGTRFVKRVVGGAERGRRGRREREEAEAELNAEREMNE